MLPRFVATLALSVAAALPAPVAAQSLNLYCSSPDTAWCQGMAVGHAISHVFARYGSSDARKRLLDRWEREINAVVR